MNIATWTAIRGRFSTEEQRLGIEVALQYTWLLQATDERDHVYALIGLVPALRNYGFKIDYTESTNDLSIRLGEFLFQQGCGLFCIGRAIGINAENRATWSPLLKPKYMTAGLALSSSTENAAMYQACGGTQFNGVAIEGGSSGKRVSIEATRVDTVSSVCPSDVGSFPNVSTEQALEVQDSEVPAWFLGCRRWANDTFRDMTSEQLEESFWRTLTMDVRDKNRRVVPTVDRRGFEVFDALMRDKLDDFASAADQLQLIWFIRRIVMCYERHLCQTSNGRMALMPTDVRENDEIWILSGVQVPLVLRENASASGWQLVGRCYVHGLMDAEALNLPTWSPEMIDLV